MQSVSSRTWTRVAMSISYDDNHYTTVTSKMEYMCFNQTGNISIQNSSSLKLVGKFTYLWSSVSLTKIDINTLLAKLWIALSILLYGCTTWTLTKRMEKKLDGNYTRMLWSILNKSWRQHPTKQQLYGHLPLFA